MKCKVARRRLALGISGDLRRRKMAALKAHLDSCPGCREEFRAFQKSLEMTRVWIHSHSPEWLETEWREIVKQAVPGKRRQKGILAPWPFKPVWAVATMALIVLAFSLVIVRPSGILSPPSQQASKMIEQDTQEVVSMTLVSKETGLKINWYFTKNFNLEVIE